MNELEFAKSVGRMIQECHSLAKSNGFWDEEPNVGEKIALMHSELSECLESLRKGDREDDHLPQFQNSVVELADVIIRIFDFAGYYNLPLAEAILAKHAFNKSRPFRHGKNF